MQSMEDSQGKAVPADPARYTLDFGVDGKVALRLDCNRGSGTWKAEPAASPDRQRSSGQLLFGPLATTRAQCAPGSLSNRLTNSLPYVRSYVIASGQLHLSLMADGGILSWSPAPR